MEVGNMASRLIDSDILVRIEDVSPNARLLYLCLDINGGGHISRIYKFSYGILVGLTGLSLLDVKKALEELISEGLAEVDAKNKIVWIVEGFEDEKNKNQWVINGVLNQLEKLSGSPLADRFRLRYESVLTDPGSDSPSGWVDRDSHGDSLRDSQRDSRRGSIREQRKKGKEEGKGKGNNTKKRKREGDGYDPLFDAFWEGLAYKRGSKRKSEDIFLRVLNTKGQEEAGVITACMRNYEQYVSDVLKRRDDFGVDKILHVKTFLNGDRYLEFERRYWKKDEGGKKPASRIERAVESVADGPGSAGKFEPKKTAARDGSGMGRINV